MEARPIGTAVKHDGIPTVVLNRMMASRPQIVADEQQDILPAGLVISGRAAASKQPRVSYAKLAHSWPRVLQHVSRLAPGAGKELLCQQPTALERGARAVGPAAIAARDRADAIVAAASHRSL